MLNGSHNADHFGCDDEASENAPGGLKKGGSAYPNKFIADFEADHGFDIAKIEATTAFSKAICEKIGGVSVEPTPGR